MLVMRGSVLCRSAASRLPRSRQALRMATSSSTEESWLSKRWAAARASAAEAVAGAREMKWKNVYEAVSSEAKLAWSEMTQGKKREVLRQSLRSEEAPDEEDDDSPEYEGTRALLVVDEEDTWAKLRERLREAPIIQDILKSAKKLGKTQVGKAAGAVGTSIKDRVEDAREYWETSQNPLVYGASSIIDTVTAENDYAAAVRELRRLDPSFSVEEWREAVSRDLVPQVITDFINGDIGKLKQWLSEGLFSRLGQEIRLRKQEGLRYDDARIVDCESADIIAVQLDDNGRNPVFLMQCMTQQINCVRNREGEVVEGSPNDIRAYFYVFAFRRDYDPKTSTLAWKIIDLQLGGGETYY